MACFKRFSSRPAPLCRAPIHCRLNNSSCVLIVGLSPSLLQTVCFFSSIHSDRSWTAGGHSTQYPRGLVSGAQTSPCSGYRCPHEAVPMMLRLIRPAKGPNKERVWAACLPLRVRCPSLSSSPGTTWGLWTIPPEIREGAPQPPTQLGDESHTPGGLA